MARKRVNIRFVIILGGVILTLMLAVLLAKKFLWKEKPDKYLAMGRELMVKGNYEEAAKQFRWAVRLDSKNAESWVEFGDALNQLSSVDPEYLNKARYAWDQALTVDPVNKHALNRLLSFWNELADLDPRPEFFESLRKTAETLTKVEPDNATADAARYSAIVRRWLGGVETDPAKIDDAIDKLTAILRKNPGNAELPVYIAKAKLYKADRARQRNPFTGDAEGNKLVNEANAVIDQAVKDQPKSAAMYFGAAQVVELEWQQAVNLAARVVPRIDPKDPNNREGKLLKQYMEEAQKYQKRKKDLLDSAKQLVPEDDQLYVYIHVKAASAAAQAGDRAGAEKILRDLIAKKPDDQQVRLALAEHIGMDKRDEALEILDRPITLQNLKGPKALVARTLEVRTLSAATSMRLDAYGAAKDEQKKVLSPKIEDGINKIVLKEGDGVRSLLLRGKYLRAQGKIIDAIQTLERARAMAEQDAAGQERQLDRWEIVDLLSRSYIETRQSGRAKTLLTELVRRFENYLPARILLAQLLIREQQMEEARVHVDALRAQAPGNADVIKLEIQLLDTQTQKEQIHRLVATLPEKTRAEQLDKVNSAMVVRDKEEALRIMALLEKEYPKDDEVMRLAFKTYQALGERDRALAVVKRAREAHPESSDLPVLVGVMDTPTTMPGAEMKQKLREGLLAKEPDGFRKVMMQADFAREDGKSDEQLAHLKEAQKLQPDDLEVKMQLFNLYIQRKQFEVAANYIEPLARANRDQVNGLLLKYRLAMAKGDINAGIDYGRKLVQTMPEFGQSWLALAESLQAAQQYDEALAKFLSALDKQSDNGVAYRGAIECYYSLGRKEDAKRMITKARSVQPNNPTFSEMELNHELSYGDPESMIPGREEALKKEPDDAGVLLMAGRTYMASARARLRKDPDDKANALAYQTKAKQLFVKGVEKWPDEPAFYAYTAEVAAQMRDLPYSEKILKQLPLREDWKDRPEPLMLLGEFYARTLRPDDAVKVLKEAMTKAPTNVDVEMRLATVLAEQKRYDDAIKALAANPEDPRIVRRKIEIMISAGKLEEADAAVAAAQAKMPNMVDLRALAGSISLTRSRYDEAVMRLQQALQIDPKHAATHYYYGLVLMSQPKPDIDGAIQHLIACRDAAGVGVDARRALAECFKKKNDFDGAVRELETAQKSNPTNKDVILALLDAYLAMNPPRLLDVKRVVAEWEAAPDYRPDVEIIKREVSMYVQQKNYVDAAASLGEAIKADPKNTELIRQYLGLLLQTQNYPIVVNAATKLVEREPTWWWAYVARATARRYQTDRAGALADYQLALNSAADKQNDDAVSEIIRSMAKEIGVGEAQLRIKDRAEKEPRWALMSAYLYQQDNPPKIEEAVKQLEKVLAMPNINNSEKETALRYGGSLYLQTRPKPDTQKAYQCYLQLLDLAPNDLTALNNMACLLAEVMTPPRPDEALKYSTRAYGIMQKTNTREPLILDTHGWMLVLGGQVDDGIALLQNVVDTAPVVDARYHLAEAYLKKAFPEEARKQLELAQAMLARMEAEHRPYDRTLVLKIKNAMMRTQEMLRGKSQANVN